MSYEKWTKETIYLVKASQYEHKILWKDWAQKALQQMPELKGFPTKKENKIISGLLNIGKRVKWETLDPAYKFQVGQLDKQPVEIEISWDKINGKLIAFWKVSSQVADHQQIERWIKKTFPNVPKGDPTSFHLVLEKAK